MTFYVQGDEYEAYAVIRGDGGLVTAYPGLALGGPGHRDVVSLRDALLRRGPGAKVWKLVEVDMATFDALVDVFQQMGGLGPGLAMDAAEQALGSQAARDLLRAANEGVLGEAGETL